MKNKVVIKSYPNGISLWLEEECEFTDILDEIRVKFSESRTFFGNAKVALSLEGRTLSSTEQYSIVQCIQENSNLRVLCIVGKDPEKEQEFLKAIERVNRYLSDEDAGGQFYKGTLKNKELLETESSIVILGDVYPGCTVISAHDIIVLGGLYGEAYAGGNGERKHYVVALEMSPEQLTIGDLKYKGFKQSKWGIKPKVQPKIAYVKNDKIAIESLTKELLSAF